MRAHLNKAIIRKTSGLPADGTVQVYEPGTTTPLGQTIYVGDTGVTARANPFAFANGVIDFYLDTPQRVDLVITPTGGAAQTFADLDVAAPAGPALTFGAVTAETTFGLSASNGAATSAARSDHAHGTPATPSAASVGAVAKTGDTMTGQLFVNVNYPASGTTGTPGISLGGRGSFQSQASGSTIISDNLVYNGSQYVTRETGGTRRNGFLEFFDGGLKFWNAPQAAAGSVVAVVNRFSVDAAGRLDATTIYDGGNRVYSASNPPPASGMSLLGGANAVISTAGSIFTFVAPATGRVQLQASGYLTANYTVGLSLDNSTFITILRSQSGTDASSDQCYGILNYAGLTPGSTYTVYLQQAGTFSPISVTAVG